MKRITLMMTCVLALFVSSCAVKVACVGDSITEGAGHKWQSKTGYPVVLNQLLGERYQVMNLGRSGATLLKKGDLPYWSCKEFTDVFVYNPKIIIIKLGTNDTKPQNWNAGNFEKDYQALIDTFNTMKPKPSIYLCEPVPVFATRWGINDSTLVNGVLPVVKRLAGKNHLPVIDLNTGMKDEGKNFPDNIHPNEVGAAKMAEIVARAINGSSQKVGGNVIKY
ncbi:MAG: GDSL-type esterase/lipase family protein [Paludibacter sp.]|nr:GDSL-type esterase/lipase family protein [Paludibacter sp.]